MSDFLARFPDWPAVLAATHGAALGLLKWILHWFPSLTSVENVLAHIPVWTSAIVGVLGVLFLILKHRQMLLDVRAEWHTWRCHRARRRQARRRQRKKMTE